MTENTSTENVSLPTENTSLPAPEPSHDKLPRIFKQIGSVFAVLFVCGFGIYSVAWLTYHHTEFATSAGAITFLVFLCILVFKARK